MKIKRLLFVVTIILFQGCKPILSTIKNTNTHKYFKNYTEYLKFVAEKTKIPENKFVILNNNLFNPLIVDITSKKLGTYYGIVNGAYFVSAEQLEIKSCSGQINELYKLFTESSDKITRTKTANLSIWQSLNSDDSKNTLIFLYSYKLGGLSKDKINSVIEKLKNYENFDYRILTLDNYDINVK